jgi:hypothetical protein
MYGGSLVFAMPEDAAPSGAWEFFLVGLLQICRTYGAGIIQKDEARFHLTVIN